MTLLQGYSWYLCGNEGSSTQHIPRTGAGWEPGCGLALQPGSSLLSIPPPGRTHQWQRLALCWVFLPLPMSHVHEPMFGHSCPRSPEACSLGEMAVPLGLGSYTCRGGRHGKQHRYHPTRARRASWWDLSRQRPYFGKLPGSHRSGAQAQTCVRQAPY